MWPFSTLIRKAQEKRPITLTNASRVILAHWLAFAAWRGKLKALELRAEIHEAFRLGEVRPVLAQNGALVSLHLPVRMPALAKEPQGNPHAAAAARQANELAQQRAQEEWFKQPFTCELSRAAAKLALAALEGHPTPQNCGLALLPTLKALKAACG